MYLENAIAPMPAKLSLAGGRAGGRFPVSAKWVTGLGVLGLILLHWPATTASGWFLLNLYLFCVFKFLLIIPHELAHALTAAILRLRVFRVVLGTGRRVASFRCCGWTWEIREILVGGMTRVSARSPSAYRLKHFLVALAGPLAGAVPAVAMAVAAGLGRRFNVSFTDGICLPAILTLASLASVGAALLPWKGTGAGGGLQSDGLTLLQLPFLSDAEIRARLAWYYSLAGAEARRRGCLEKALACYEEGLDRLGAMPVLVMDKAAALIGLGRYAEARELLATLLERENLGAGFRLLTMNNLACVDLLLREDHYLAEADRLSSEALAAAPAVPAFCSTRGAVLLATGEIAAGLALLKNNINHRKTWEKKGQDACWIALGEARRGNRERAREFTALAETLAPDSHLLAFVREELAGETGVDGLF